MKFSVGYKDLVEAFNHTKVATSSKNIKDEAKNAIFNVTEDGSVTVGAFTQSAQIRVSLDATDVEGAGFFQLKASRLNEVLAPFTTLSRTEVESITFDVRERNIIIHVNEVETGEDATGEFDQSTRYSYGFVEVPPKVIESFNKTAGDDVDEVPSRAFDLFFKDLMPLLSNDGSGNLNSSLNITEEFIFMVLNRQVSGYRNRIGTEKLNGGRLDYSQIATIVALSATAETVDVATVSDRTVSFSTDKIEYFVNPVKAGNINFRDSYDPVFKTEEALEQGIVLDRGYLKDVLSRFEYAKQEQPVFRVTDHGLVISSESIKETRVPILQTFGEMDGVGFKLDPTFFKKMIIGDDAVYGDFPLHVYLKPKGKGLSVFITDEKKAWLSTATVTAENNE